MTEDNKQLWQTMLAGMIATEHIAAAKITDGVPSAYRLARKLDDQLVLQGAYRWTEGRECGVEWREIPTVYLDANGEAMR